MFELIFRPCRCMRLHTALQRRVTRGLAELITQLERRTRKSKANPESTQKEFRVHPWRSSRSAPDLHHSGVVDGPSRRDGTGTLAPSWWRPFPLGEPAVHVASESCTGDAVEACGPDRSTMLAFLLNAGLTVSTNPVPRHAACCLSQVSVLCNMV